MTLKSDEEPVLVDLLKESQRWSDERNSQAIMTIEHGYVGRGVQSFGQVFRTFF